MTFEMLIQAVPPIYVTIQQPPPGMPEWVKILTTSVIGVSFGIASAPLTEAVKGYFSRKALRKTIQQGILRELPANLDKVIEDLSGLRASHKEELQDLRHLDGLVHWLVDVVDSDIYQHYFATQKTLVYEIDPKKYAAEFYRFLKDSTTDNDSRTRSEFAIGCWEAAIIKGNKFLDTVGTKHFGDKPISEQLADMKRKFS